MNAEPSRPFRRRNILRVSAAILLVLLAALAWRGHLYPVLPKRLVGWWVQRVVPLHSSIPEARAAATRHGWRITGHGGPCITAAPQSTFLTVELGSLWLLAPAVSYSYASLCFDGAGRLQSITVTREIDAPRPSVAVRFRPPPVPGARRPPPPRFACPPSSQSASNPACSGLRFARR